MRAVLQRVEEAEVRVEGELVSRIGRGILVFLGVAVGDEEGALRKLVGKVAGLRIFDDDRGRMNRSNEEVGGAYLVVSQFTLCADLTKGKRPGFDRAMKPPESERLYERFCTDLEQATGRPVSRGRFGADMRVRLVNAGPATFLIET